MRQVPLEEDLEYRVVTPHQILTVLQDVFTRIGLQSIHREDPLMVNRRERGFNFLFSYLIVALFYGIHNGL